MTADVAPALELEGIWKDFGSVRALQDVTFDVRPGEIHGLIGENGAGKSTLMHVAFGLVRPDRGQIRVRGRPASVGSPNDAKRLGIGMVHQHFTSVPTMTVRENLWLAGESAPPAGGSPSRPFTEIRATLVHGIDEAAMVESLTVGEKQRLELLLALATDCRILLLDEPTAVLAPRQVEQLSQLLRRYAAQGGSVVLISHKLEEVLDVVDRVTVLRRGVVVRSAARDAVDRNGLASAMVGGAMIASAAPPPVGSTSEVRARFGQIEVHPGEIVGVAAVEGNGQREILRGVAGLSPSGGAVGAFRAAFLPEDRTTEGLIPGFSITENLVLGRMDDPRWVRGSWLDWASARNRATELIAEFQIRANDPAVPVHHLSGGNQQKLVVARATEGRPELVVAENPTRGLDFQAAAFVHAKLRELARAGAAVILYSTDLDEVIELATRLVVVYRGQVSEAPAGASRDQIGMMMLGVPPA